MPAELPVEVLFVITGIIAGVLAGLFGVGGGLIIVPALYWILPRMGIACDVTMHLAIGTSLATIIITSVSSAYSHYRRQSVDVRAFLLLTPGLILGALFASMLADFFNTRVLIFIFAIFEMFVAFQLIFALRPDAQRELPGRTGMLASGAGIGTISGLVGIGGGTLTVPFMVWCNTPIKRAVGTSAACGLPIAVAGMFGYWWAGHDAGSLPAGTSGFVLWSAVLWIGVSSLLLAPLGAWIAHRIHSSWLKRAFAVLLLGVSLKMLWDGFSGSALAACH